MAVIEKINDWMLGDATVDPPVEVVNTKFRTWEPDELGRYTIQALHYSVMHPHVLRRDDDLQRAAPYSSVTAHNRSLLWVYAVAETASRLNVIDADGNPYGPISVSEADKLDYSSLNLRIDSDALRIRSTDFYHSIGGITLKWIGDPPEIALPLESRYFFPDGFPGQEQTTP
jgi:hypothetical protein